MKVLKVHNFYQRPGGEDQVFRNEGALLEANGHEVIRFTRHNDDVDAFGRAALLRRTVWNRDTERELDALVARERPDVMHCHNTFPLVSPSAYAAARGHGVAVVQTLHNYRLVCPKAELMREGVPCELCLGRAVAWPAVRHRCYRGSRAASAAVAAMLAVHGARGTWNDAVDRYITMTEFGRGKFGEGGLPAERIAVKPHFVPGAPEPGGGEGGHVVFVGRLSPEKGVTTLLDAWSRLDVGRELRILGDGPLADDVRAAAAGDGRIRPLGHRSPAQVMDEIGRAALLVMPSVWYETFGLCIAEAFAKGTPVVASDLGAMAELVEHGRTGLLAPPGDAAALAETLARGLALAPAMRAAARARYESTFSEAAALPPLLAVYRDAMKRAASRANVLGFSKGSGADPASAKDTERAA